MKAKTVNENMDFERGQDPKASIGIGKSRYKKPGDREFGKHFLQREGPRGNSMIFINTLNGKEIEVGLFAFHEVRKSLETLID
jgi:hypothetical protein